MTTTRIGWEADEYEGEDIKGWSCIHQRRDVIYAQSTKTWSTLDSGWVLEGDSDDDDEDGEEVAADGRDDDGNDDDDDDDGDDDDDDGDEVHGAADGRDAARPIRQDLSNWVTVDGPLTLHKKSEGDDEFEFWIDFFYV